jgi:phosphate transport system permease protein
MKVSGKLLKVWAGAASLLVTAALIALVYFVAVNALPAFSWGLIFGDTNPLDALFRGALVWDGLWTPFSGTLRLLALSLLFAVPVDLSIGIFTAEYARAPLRKTIVMLLESLAGLPSIIVGLFGFVLVLLLRRFVPASCCLLLAAFCLSILVLPVLSLSVYTALRGLPQALRLTAASLGMSKDDAIFRVLLPAGRSGVVSGILLAAGRCAEDTAVILVTGAVAVSHSGGLFSKFEALSFFIYYTNANYQSEQQLAQVFAASFLLLVISLALLVAGLAVKK